MPEEKGSNTTIWEKCISKAVGQEFVCDGCAAKTISKEVGEHVRCAKCNKFIWRVKG